VHPRGAPSNNDLGASSFSADISGSTFDRKLFPVMRRREEDDMSAFTVEFDNRAGELARLCEAMAAHGVNIVLCGAAHGDTGTVAFIADDERGARDALEGADIEYDERPALTIRMENVPGAGAKAFRRLADAGVNIDLLLPVRVSAKEFLAVICAENLDAAAGALGDQVVSD
jgi:hypothetical protein